MPVPKEKRKEYRRKLRDKNAKMCLEYKGGKCEDCGITLTYENDKGNYDFHHINPTTKSSGINIMLKDKVSTERLINELDKCVLLCKPCHNKRHSDYKKGLRETL